MVARMNRLESAARLSMADLGPEAPAARSGTIIAIRFGLIVAGCTWVALVVASLL